MTIIKLPEKFNEYDPETLKHLQDVYLMMLKDFIKVCDENQIEYYLDGGSALGAVRHQGFIPWDDDIDIILFRDEYNRLIEILEKLPQDKYELLSSKNKKCYCRLHSQWNLKGTKTEAYYDMNTDFTLGICLDIFVLDNIPNDGLRKKIFSIKQTLIRKLIWSYEITNSEAYISKNKERMGKILKIIFKIFRINFTKIKKIGDTVKHGDVILKVDLRKIEELGKKIDTPIVVMDAEDKEIKKITGAATAGETVIMEVK